MTPPANQDGRHSQTLFNIGPYRKFILKSSRLELLAQLEPNFGGLVLRWSSFRIITDDPTRQPRWPPQLIFSNMEPNGKFIDKFSRLELLAQLELNFGGMVTRMLPFRIILAQLPTKMATTAKLSLT